MKIWKKFGSEKVITVLFALYLFNNYFLGGTLVFIDVTGSLSLANKIIDLVIACLALSCAYGVKYTRKEIVILLAGYLLAVLIFFTTGEMSVAFFWTWIILGKQMPYDRWIRVSLYCNCAGIVTGLASTFLGVHHDIPVNSRSLLGTRYTFGLGQPNFTGNILFLIAASYCWLKKENLRIRDYLVPLFITAVCYVFPNSQGTTIVLLAFILVVFLFQYFIRDSNMKRRGLHFLFCISIVFAALSIILSVINVAQIPLLGQIDQVMSYRYTDAYRTYKEYGFSLFGQQVDFAELNTYARLNGERNYYMDCMWIYLPVHYGILFSVFFVYIYFSAMYIFVKKEDVPTVIIFFCGALYAMEQRIWPTLFTWVFMIFWAEKLFQAEYIDSMGEGSGQITGNGNTEKSF